MNTHVLWVCVHSLAVLVFVNRYIAGVVLRIVRGKNWDEQRTDDREHEALGEELSNQPRSRSSQRSANRELLRARSSAREQEVRHVGAGDQQHEANRAQQRYEQTSIVANQLVDEWSQDHSML